MADRSSSDEGRADGYQTSLDAYDQCEDGSCVRDVARVGRGDGDTGSPFEARAATLPASGPVSGAQHMADLVNFFNNKIIKMPPNFADLEELEDLNFASNKLKTIPKAPRAHSSRPDPKP